MNHWIVVIYVFKLLGMTLVLFGVIIWYCYRTGRFAYLLSICMIDSWNGFLIDIGVV